MQTHFAAVHEGKKPFKCDLCEKTYTQKSHLNTHIRAVHGEKKQEKPFNRAKMTPTT